MLAAMPFCHLKLVACKPKNNSYLWKASHYPANPQNIGEQIKKRRFDLKMTAVECQKLLGVDKSTLTKWEQGKHKPRREMRKEIARFLGYDPTPTNCSGQF
jgi:DNA-binding transcriptional regulator YiaG